MQCKFIILASMSLSSLFIFPHHPHQCFPHQPHSRSIHDKHTCLSLLQAFPSNCFSIVHMLFFTDSMSVFYSLSAFDNNSGCSEPCPTSTQTSITSILSLLVKSTPHIFLHGDCSVCPKMHSVNAPHLGKRHVRPWVHDPGTLTDVCLMLTLGNPSPAYPCTHAYPRSPGRK